MKKVLVVAGIVLLNVFMIALAFLLYVDQTIPLMRATDNPYAIENLIIFPIVFIALLVFLMNRRFRYYGIGSTVLFIYTLVFLTFYLNRSLAREGEYESIRLWSANWVDSKFYVNVDFRMGGNNIEVTMEKCFKVDSVQVRINKGFFGMGTITKDVRIVEQTDCEEPYFDSTELLQSHLDHAHHFAEKRCFSSAILHYTRCFELDSLNPIYPYHRGQMFMVTENYNQALIDFLMASLLTYQQLDTNTLDVINNIDPNVYMQEFFTKIENKDYDGALDYVANLNTLDDLDTYRRLIAFCLKKVKEGAKPSLTAFLRTGKRA
ncbi:MAG TPA: hypothetical protein DIW47_08010 [Bacteroidetes bacterium]|nr:hypothetical protein [Bacteroidota bacterium]